MSKNLQGVHAGQDGPAFVFGRKNLDYQGPDLQGTISRELKDPSGDFTVGGDPEYASIGSLSDVEELRRRQDASQEFLRFLFDENHIPLRRFDDLDDNKKDDLISEFVSSREDTVDDDAERIHQEYLKDKFGLGSRSLLQSEDVQLFDYDYIEDNEAETTLPSYVKLHGPNMKKSYYQWMIAGHGDRSPLQDVGALRSHLNDKDKNEVLEAARSLVAGWRFDMERDGNPSHPYQCVAEVFEDGDRCEDLPLLYFDARQIEANPQQLQDNLFWGHDEHGVQIVPQHVEMLRNKDGSLEYAIGSSDKKVTKLKFRPLNPKEHYLAHGEIKGTPTMQELHENPGKFDYDDVFHIVSSFVDSGYGEEFADELHRVDPKGNGWISQLMGPLSRNTMFGPETQEFARKQVQQFARLHRETKDSQ